MYKYFYILKDYKKQTKTNKKSTKNKNKKDSIFYK